MQKAHVAMSWSLATRKISRHVDEITMVEQMDPREPAQPEMPHSREDFVVHSCIEVCFFPVETVTPTLKSDGAQKNFGFLLLCAKMHMKFE